MKITHHNPNLLLELQSVAFADKSVLRNLMELYLYDFSGFSDLDVNSHGLYGYDYLDLYFNDSERISYFIAVNGKYAGFVMINSVVSLSDSELGIAEFFVMKKYRRRGIGTAVVRHILNQRPSIWEVRILQGNIESHQFWQGFIKTTPEISVKCRIEDRLADWNGIVMQLEISPTPVI